MRICGKCSSGPTDTLFYIGFDDNQTTRGVGKILPKGQGICTGCGAVFEGCFHPDITPPTVGFDINLLRRQTAQQRLEGWLREQGRESEIHYLRPLGNVNYHGPRKIWTFDSGSMDNYFEYEVFEDGSVIAKEITHHPVSQRRQLKAQVVGVV